MTIMTAAAPVEVAVIGGIDTHADTIHVTLISALGRDVAHHEFRTTAAGYRAAVAFLTGHGLIGQVGIEGTSSYGAGITRAVLSAGIEVIEVNRPSPIRPPTPGQIRPARCQSRRPRGAVRPSDQRPQERVDRSDPRPAQRRHSAVKARTATINQITGMLVTAPEVIRTKYRALQGDKLVAAISTDTTVHTDPVHRTVLTALTALAARYHFLTDQAQELLRLIDTLVTAANPGLRAAFGVGPDPAAQLLITAGNNPERLGAEAAFAAPAASAPCLRSPAKPPDTGCSEAVTAQRTPPSCGCPWTPPPAPSFVLAPLRPDPLPSLTDATETPSTSEDR